MNHATQRHPIAGKHLILGILVTLALISNCHSPPPTLQPPLTHPLTGRIWNSTAGHFVEDVSELVQGITPTSVVVIGEKHDNALHREIQLSVLREFLRQEHPVDIAWEVFNHSDQTHLDHYLKNKTLSSNTLAETLQWDKRGWAPWRQFSPFLETARIHHLSALGANLQRDLIRKVARHGFSALPSPLLERLKLNTRSFLNGDQVSELTRDIQESHCGMLDEAMARSMVPAQQTRDAIMASTLSATSTARSTLAFMGNEHARQDRGVPHYLRQYQPQSRVVAIHLVEVEASRTDPLSYQDYSHTSHPTFFWFTPQAERSDPCEIFRKHAAPKARSTP